MLPILAADTVVAIDGKTRRRSGKVDATPLHLVSAFAAGATLVLGQRATAAKSNEKIAIPQLLATLVLEDGLAKPEQWPDLKSFAVIEPERSINGKTSREQRFYAS